MALDLQVRDDLGEVLVLAAPARRIVSLVPSLTACLIDLGRGATVVGRTSFCPGRECFGDHFDVTADVGGTKTLRIDAIEALEPDVVLAVKEENTREGIEELRRRGLPVLVFDPCGVESLPALLRSLGAICGAPEPARRMEESLLDTLSRVRERAALRGEKPAAYLIWKDPYMIAGPRTYIGELLRAAGLTCPFGDVPSRYPSVTPQQIVDAGAEIVFFSSEPYCFGKSHLEEFREKAGIGPTGPPRLLLCRGDLVGWYPSRTEAALLHVEELIGEQS